MAQHTSVATNHKKSSSEIAAIPVGFEILLTHSLDLERLIQALRQASQLGIVTITFVGMQQHPHGNNEGFP
jgi:hypothetical protein